jgi:hypothetical protein
MLAELAADLLEKVRSVEALTNSAALTIGGKALDPDLTKIPLPAAWVVLRKEGKDVTPYERNDMSGVVDEYMLGGIWTVTVMVPYLSDEDLLTTQYPLLESVRKAIHKNAVAIEEADGAMRWAYMGMRIALVYTDRLAYEQTYHVNYATSS